MSQQSRPHLADGAQVGLGVPRVVQRPHAVQEACAVAADEADEHACGRLLNAGIAVAARGQAHGIHRLLARRVLRLQSE